MMCESAAGRMKGDAGEIGIVGAVILAAGWQWPRRYWSRPSPGSCKAGSPRSPAEAQAAVIGRLARRLGVMRGDEGTIAVVSYAIAFPVVLGIIAAVMQAAMWFAARNAAIAAAQQGVAVARAQGGTRAQGEAAACGYAASAAAGILRGPACTGGGGTTITITVCEDALQLLPAFNVRACKQARGARERFTTELPTRTSP